VLLSTTTVHITAVECTVHYNS